MVLDFGGVYDGYCVDLTRTCRLARPTPELSRLVRGSAEAQEAAIAAVRPGVAAERDRRRRAGRARATRAWRRRSARNGARAWASKCTRTPASDEPAAGWRQPDDVRSSRGWSSRSSRGLRAEASAASESKTTCS